MSDFVSFLPLSQEKNSPSENEWRSHSFNYISVLSHIKDDSIVVLLIAAMSFHMNKCLDRSVLFEAVATNDMALSTSNSLQQRNLFFSLQRHTLLFENSINRILWYKIAIITSRLKLYALPFYSSSSVYSVFIESIYLLPPTIDYFYSVPFSKKKNILNSMTLNWSFSQSFIYFSYQN